MYRSHVLVCGGTGCTSSNSAAIIEALETQIAEKGLSEEIKVIRTGCFGLCALGPIMIVYPEATFYSMVKPEYVPEIVSEHLLKGRVVTKYVYDETVTDEGIKPLLETDFYKKQHRIALRNCGVINPEDIDENMIIHAISPDKDVDGFHPQNDGISSGFLIELIKITEFTINTGNNAIKTIILKIFFSFCTFFSFL